MKHNNSTHLDTITSTLKELKEEGITSITYQELAERTGISKQSVCFQLNQHKCLPNEFNITIEKVGRKPNKDEKPRYDKKQKAEPEPILCKNVEPQEPLFETTVNGEKKLCYLKDFIYTCGTGRKVPKGMMVVWKDGVPHSLGEKGCTFNNVKLVLDPDYNEN